MKENIKIRNDDLCVSICTIEHIEEIIEFIYRLNNRVESASNFCPKSKEYIKEEILNGINDNSFFIYWENNKVLGTINYYLDEVRNNRPTPPRHKNPLKVLTDDYYSVSFKGVCILIIDNLSLSSL